MVLTHQPAISLRDVGVACGRREPENAIGILHRFTGRALISRTARRFLHAQDRFHLREFEFGHAEHLTNSDEQRSLLRVQAASEKGSLQLNLNEHSPEIASIAQYLIELGQCGLQWKVVRLAFGKKVDCAADIRFTQTKLGHDGASRSDLFFRDPSVRFRNMPHRLKGGSKECLGDGVRGARRSLRRLNVEVMSDDHAHEHAEGVPRHEITDQCSH
jgi:hypothetical protein